MARVKRYTAYEGWHNGFKGLLRLSKTVDRILREMADDQLPGSGLADLKLRINRELRDNAIAQIRFKRERLELHDLELRTLAQHSTDEELLDAVRRMRDPEATAEAQGAETADEVHESPGTSEGPPETGPREATTEAEGPRTDETGSTEEAEETVH